MKGQVTHSKNLPDKIIEVQLLAEDNTKDNDNDFQSRESLAQETFRTTEIPLNVSHSSTLVKSLNSLINLTSELSVTIL
ncbi:5299_t:CDS:2 [Ambispora leptoticha]|uniref:5299_t:CDS:1 n=1 Tax=Ambispora leptoticha TaxID=144679 RepID=A0A9N8Z357_9GLOM|nr:5299_t:CDS:2 [Ambispora leptoticha]